MQLIEIIETLEKQSNQRRFELITGFLRAWEVPYFIHQYDSGKNIVIPAGSQRFVGVSSHFDVVPQSGGANDNASAIAVCLEIVRRRQKRPLQNIGIQVFIFDEEETGLKGSQAYIERFGLTGMIGLLNMEMVGMGNQFALWALDEQSKGTVLETFEKTAHERKIPCRRFDKIVTNLADHLSFQNANLSDAFTITCITDKDLETAYHYYKALEFEVDLSTLHEIIAQAPLFKHYHQPTDLSTHLNEQTLQMTLDTIWETILALERRY
jgi:Zn-dependent M28 family amino/carboxypeptidase